MSRASRVLRAIVFADMVGYTSLMGRDEALAIELRRRYRSVLDEAVDRWGGEIVQHYGDGALCLFQSAVQATRCFVEVQLALRESPPVSVRVGIHVADVVRDEEGVWGNGVNVASRIQALCEPGGVLVSARVGQDLGGHRDLRLRPMGRRQVKNVPGGVEIHAVVIGETSGDEAPAPDSIEASWEGSDADGRRAVAVLPFLSLSADPDNEIFSDGITEEIINALTGIRGIDVTSRTSSFAFKGQQADIRGIARELGVDTVLEGSVRRAGKRVRVTAQLIDAQTGYHLFARNFDRELQDIFAIQDEISGAIADAFRTTIVEPPARLRAPEEVGIAHGAGAADPEALSLYLKARSLWHRWTPEAATEAVATYERAIQLDPDLARAYAGLATALTYLGAVGRLRSSEAYPRAQKAASQGLMLDADSAEAHQALGLAALFYLWDGERAKLHFQTALELAPGSAEILHTAALCRSILLDWEESEALALKALELDPLSVQVQISVVRGLVGNGHFTRADEMSARVVEAHPEVRSAWEMRGVALLYGGRFEEARAAFLEYRGRSPTPFAGATWLGLTAIRLGETAEAERELEHLRVRERSQPEINIDLDVAGLLMGLGRIDEAFERIEHAIENRTAAVVFLCNSPFFLDVHGHPRFRAAMAKIGLWRGTDAERLPGSGSDGL